MENIIITIVTCAILSYSLVNTALNIRTTYNKATNQHPIIDAEWTFEPAPETTPIPKAPDAPIIYHAHCAPARRLSQRRRNRVTAHDVARMRLEIKKEITRCDQIDHALNTLKEAAPTVSARVLNHLERTLKHLPALQAAENNVYHPASQSRKAHRIRARLAFELTA